MVSTTVVAPSRWLEKLPPKAVCTAPKKARYEKFGSLYPTLYREQKLIDRESCEHMYALT